MASVLKDTALSVAASGASLAAALASSIFVARLLGPSGAGMVAMAFWLATVAAALADRGLPQLLLRYGGASADHPSGRPGLLTSVLPPFCGSLLVVGVGLAALLAAGPGWIGLDSATTVAAVGLYALYGLSALSIAAARSRDRFDQIARTSLWGGAIQIVLVPAGAMLAGPAGALAGHAARYLPQALQLRSYFTAERTAISRGMRTYARNLWLSDLVEVALLSRVEFLFLGVWLGDAAIGYFAIGLTIVSPIEQILLQMSPALLVWFVRARSDADPAAAGEAYRRALRSLALITLPVSFGGAVILPDLIPLVFGGAFAPAVPAAMLLMLSLAPAALTIVPWSMLGAAEHSRALLRVQLLAGVASAVLLAVAVPFAGIIGAAALRLLTVCLTLAALAVIVLRSTGLGFPARALGRIALAAALSAAAAAAPLRMFESASALVVAIPLGAVVYFAAIRFLRLLDRQDVLPLVAAIDRRLPAALAAASGRLLDFLAPAPA